MSAKDELDLLDTLLDKGKPMGRKQGSVSSFGMGSTNKDYQDNVNTKKGIHDRKGSSSMDLAPNFSFFKPVKANPTPPQQPYPQ